MRWPWTWTCNTLISCESHQHNSPCRQAQTASNKQLSLMAWAQGMLKLTRPSHRATLSTRQTCSSKFWSLTHRPSSWYPSRLAGFILWPGQFRSILKSGSISNESQWSASTLTFWHLTCSVTRSMPSTTQSCIGTLRFRANISDDFQKDRFLSNSTMFSFQYTLQSSHYSQSPSVSCTSEAPNECQILHVEFCRFMLSSSSFS